jgi:conjugal transfer mating pair stabilization protein TraG
MAYQVISIGDGEILYNTFQGAAMIFGGGFLDKLIVAGFILGIMLVCLTYLVSLEFPLNQVIVGFIVYLVMFVPDDTVIVEDLYTGEVRTVANVPLGVAVPMSIVSTIGLQTTILFETAFSTPNESQLRHNGYLNALNTLVKLRNIGIGSAGSDATVTGDVGQTIHGYIENCVMLDLEMTGGSPEVTREKLLKSTDLLASMLVSFVNVDVLMRLPSSAPSEQRNCADAHAALTNYLTGTGFVEQLDQYVKGVLNVNEPGVAAADRIDQATAALNLAGIDSQTYMRNAVLASYLQDGPNAFITRPGQEQLNLQWASEQGMFNEIARPLMAFVEMFTVAVSPIVAFLTTLGTVGLRMMARYLQMIAWVALWGPLMAVCNLYITIVTTRALATVAANADINGTGLDSMLMHDQLYHTLEIWLSTGGMLASSVPALALMIVYGGSVAATNLSGKMTSGVSSSIDPKRVAPEAVSIEPVQSLHGFTESSINVASKKIGMADAMNNLGSTFSRGQQSAAESLRSASQSAAGMFTQISQDSIRSGMTDIQASSIMNGVNQIANNGKSWLTSDGKTVSQTNKLTDQESQAVQAGVGAGLNLGTGFIGPSVQASLLSRDDMSVQRAKELGDLAQHIATTSSIGGDQTVSSSGSSNQSSNQRFKTTEGMSAIGEQFQTQLQKVRQASEKYSEIGSLEQSFGSNLSMSDQDLAGRLAKSGALPEISRQVATLESQMSPDEINSLSGAVNKQIAASSANLGVGSDERAALVGFKKLDNYHPMAAAEVLKNYLVPSLHDMGEGLAPMQYKNEDVTVDSVVSDEQANEFMDKSTGHIGGVAGDGRASRGNSGSSHYDHSGYSDRSGGSLQSEVREEVGAALSPDDIRNNIGQGGKLGASMIDGEEMLGRAARNNPVVGSEMDYLGQSMDSFKEIVGGNNKTSKSDMPNPPVDNDLPPIPK